MRCAKAFFLLLLLQASCLAQVVGGFDPPCIVSTAAPYGPVTTGWEARVIANGGADPSAGTLSSVDTYWNGLVTDSVDTNIAVLGIYVPDNLIATITPLVKGNGSDPWGNNNFVSGDLTVNGLTGNGSTKYLNTGLSGSGLPATQTSFAVYLYTTGGAAVVDIGVVSGTGAHWLGRDNYWRNGDPINNDIQPTPPGNGFYCDVRTSSTDHRVFFASSGSGFAQLGSTDTAALSLASPSQNFFVHCYSDQSGGAQAFSAYTISCAVVFTNFTSAKAQLFYNRTQTLRASLGGGYR
jgi:hypothetical protein